MVWAIITGALGSEHAEFPAHGTGGQRSHRPEKLTSEDSRAGKKAFRNTAFCFAGRDRGKGVFEVWPSGLGSMGRLRAGAPPKRDPGARPEPRTGVRQTGSWRRYPVLGPPRLGGGDQFLRIRKNKEKRQKKCNPCGAQCYLCPDPRVLPMS